jgi:hypothetical protein
MKAFLGEIDQDGLRRFIPEALVPRDDHGRLAWRRFRRPTTLAWALLADRNAEAVHAEVHAGRYQRACGVLLNVAAELIPIAAAPPPVNVTHPETPAWCTDAPSGR